ncbi:hypothetical protein JH06_5738 [Blastocystis sp. subtype 4]|uniref:hypothetical protein n=1 Tax=Blastocystis sp. subtype 4 TaxID=944170 RepID=UPI0007120721|nr:hypothetical protein JH06_5738 [Blastocystis sp. subtype 4]KNB42290.1 hypothetical protein JH06_5738 [Blastocystis sp. subtype 4]|eukprot:XP_014525733.1 hypothetical protein JH06_5738 [Blastocystis sp. subtype 4]
MDKMDLHDEAVRQLHELLCFDDCVRWASTLHRKLFYEEICQLIYQFPDFVDENGNKFWSGSKLFPTAIEFDASNPSHVNFVRYGALLRAACLGIPVEDHVEHMIEVVKNMKFSVFTPQDPSREGIVDMTLDVANTNEVIAQMISELPARETLKDVRTIPAEFEKDDDSNHHIDFIAACANLRAEK